MGRSSSLVVPGNACQLSGASLVAQMQHLVLSSVRIKSYDHKGRNQSQACANSMTTQHLAIGVRHGIDLTVQSSCQAELMKNSTGLSEKSCEGPWVDLKPGPLMYNSDLY